MLEFASMSISAQRIALLTELANGLPATPSEIRDLQKHLRVAAGHFDPGRNKLAAAIVDCVGALRARNAELLKTPHDNAFREKKTIAIDADELKQPGTRTGKSRHARWTAEDRLLYEDTLTLFELGDQLGALTSLERLLMISPDASEMTAFQEKNHDVLRDIYLERFGSLDRIVMRSKDRTPIKIPARKAELVLNVLRLVDGRLAVKDIARKSPFGELTTMIILSHLLRSGFVELA